MNIGVGALKRQNGSGGTTPPLAFSDLSNASMPRRLTAISILGERLSALACARELRRLRSRTQVAQVGRDQRSMLLLPSLMLPFAKMQSVTRRTLLESLSALPLLSVALLAASHPADPKRASTRVYELRIYHAAPGKLGELLTRFREHTTKLFEKHGMKSIAYWTLVDEPERGNTLIYILQHPSREAATANWKSFQDDPVWKSVKEESEANGKLADKIDSTFLALTDFSPRLH